MRTPTLLSLSLLALTACDSDCPDDPDTGDAVLADDCVVYEPVSESWEMAGQLTAPSEPVVLSVSGRGSRGAGVLTATLTWDWSGYNGFPRLDVSNANESTNGVSSYEIEQPSLTLETTLINGDSVDLIVGEFAPDIDPSNYPVDFTVALSWSDRVDCFEGNNTQAAAKRIVADVAYEAYNLSSYEDTDEAAYFDGSSDDFYTITAPDDVSRMLVDITNPAMDGSIYAALMDAGEDPYFADALDYVGGERGAAKTLEIAVTPGASYDLYVTRWEGLIFEYWALPTAEGTARPDYWDVPYGFTVSFE